MLLFCFGAHYAFYARLLRGPLAASDLEARRRALKRWVRFAVAWQAAVLVALAAYLLPQARSHPTGGLWMMPPLAAVVGTAVPLQVAVVRIMRSLRTR